MNKTKLLYITIVFIVFSFFAPWIFTQPNLLGLDFSSTGQIGDTIGGIMSPFIAILGIILTYSAFYIQYEANKQQREQFNKELKSQREQFLRTQLEHQFYEMLKIHRSNVDNLVCYKKNDLYNIQIPFLFDLFEKKQSKGIKAFSHLINELYFYYRIVSKHLSKEETKEKMSIAYELFWSGKNISSNKELKEEINLIKLADNKAFKGHSTQLSHYYRQLFQTVKFIVYHKDIKASGKIKTISFLQIIE